MQVNDRKRVYGLKNSLFTYTNKIAGNGKSQETSKVACQVRSSGFQPTVPPSANDDLPNARFDPLKLLFLFMADLTSALPRHPHKA